MPRLIPDWQWIVMTIRQEADGEPFAGKVAIAEVIRERAAAKYNSDGTIPGTILTPYQFSGWNTSDPNRKRIASIEIEAPGTIDAIKAYQQAFEDGTNISKRANLYHARTMNPFPIWTKSPNVTKLIEIGNHIFYREDRTLRKRDSLGRFKK